MAYPVIVQPACLGIEISRAAPGPGKGQVYR